MAKTLGVVLAVAALLAVLAALGLLCHGLFARAQMNRYKNSAVRNARVAPHPTRPLASQPQAPARQASQGKSPR
ncbi:MAG: hypothetical protein Q8J96_06625 [Rhodocyclaceae bacterium]|nr:hypothetical protein [Rhodocyclaceae bacterium]